MTDWRLIAIRHSIETEALYVSDHWRIWARTRDGNMELRTIQHDAAPGDEIATAIADGIGKLGLLIFPHTGLEIQ